MKALTYQRGLTMIELLVVISIVGVLGLVALPGMKQFIDNNKKSAMAYEISAALAITRSEAVKRKSNTIFCVLNATGDGCRANDGVNDLSQGWLIFTDCNDNDTYDPGTTCDTNGDSNPDFSELVKIQKPMQSAFVVSLKTKSRIKYTPSGRSANAGIDFELDGKVVKEINIATTGRVRVK